MSRRHESRLEGRDHDTPGQRRGVVRSHTRVTGRLAGSEGHNCWLSHWTADQEPLFPWSRELGEGIIDTPAHHRFLGAAAAMESVLAARDWLVHDCFSVADVMYASVLQGATRAGCRLRGRLEAYVQRGEARPGHARAAAIPDRPRS